jgi:hypothetical protein
LTASPIQAPATSGSCDEERLRDERQDEHFDHREDHDQRRHQHRHHRPRADGAADRDRRRHAADRDAGGKRRRPFAAEAEPLAGDEIHHRPVDQIGFDDRGDAAQDERARETEPSRRRHREDAAENDDGDLDVEFRPHRVLDRLGEARKEIGDDQPGDEREDIAAFIGELQRPADAEFLLLGRRYRREIGEVADHPARIGDPEHGGEGEREPLHVALERGGGGTEHHQERHVSCDQRADAAERGVSFEVALSAWPRLLQTDVVTTQPMRSTLASAARGENENRQAENDGEPVLVDRRDHARRRVAGE